MTSVLLKSLMHSSLKVNMATLTFLTFLMNICAILYSDIVYLLTSFRAI